MKKGLYIFFGILIIIGVALISVIMKYRYPDNYVYDFGGYYKENHIVELFGYDDEVIVLMRNKEITYDAWLGDNCWDEMLQIAHINSNDEIIEVVSVEETLTVENDGDGIRYNEINLSTYQKDELIYISIELYDETYMIVYDIPNKTYEVINTDFFLVTFTVDDHISLLGYVEEGNFYTLFYREYSLDFVELSYELIGKLEKMNMKPLFNDEYVVVNGNLESGDPSIEFLSVYSFTTNDIRVIDSEDAYSKSYFHINGDEIVYEMFYGDSENQRSEFYYADGTLIETIYNEDFPILSIDEKRFIRVHRDEDFWNQQLRLLDTSDSTEILLDFEQRVLLDNIYVFGNKIYLVVRFAEKGLYPLVNGANETFIIIYDINEIAK